MLALGATIAHKDSRVTDTISKPLRFVPPLILDDSVEGGVGRDLIIQLSCGSNWLEEQRDRPHASPFGFNLQQKLRLVKAGRKQSWAGRTNLDSFKNTAIENQRFSGATLMAGAS
jgi:hypothetical protein